MNKRLEEQEKLIQIILQTQKEILGYIVELNEDLLEFAKTLNILLEGTYEKDEKNSPRYIG
jgi:hypothetical protein